MPARTFRLTLTYAFAATVSVALPAQAQDAAATSSSGNSTAAMQLESWLQPQADQRLQAVASESYKTITNTAAPDPFAVLTSGALWNETYGGIYTRDLGNAFSLSYQGSNTVYDVNEESLARAEQVGFAFAPAPVFTLNGNVHGSSTDGTNPDNGTMSSGTAITAQSRMPWDTIVTVGLTFDRSIADAPEALASETRSYNAQITQPLGKLPLSAVLKSHLTQLSTGNAPGGGLPTFEQSLVWKPLANTTVQMGLRQQQYQEYPGVDHLMNEAIFADLSQRIVDNVSWHSYAELLNSKGLNDQAPASPLASGANGTPQATVPGSNASLTSSLPLSMQDQDAHPLHRASVQLQKDFSASLEYSNRWGQNACGGQ